MCIFIIVFVYCFEIEFGVDVVICYILKEMWQVFFEGCGLFMFVVVDFNLVDFLKGEVFDYVLEVEFLIIVFMGMFNFYMWESLLKKNVFDYVIKDNDWVIDFIVYVVCCVFQNCNIWVLVVDGFVFEESEVVQMLQVQQFLVVYVGSVQDVMDKFVKYWDIELVMVDYVLFGFGGIEFICQIRCNFFVEDMWIIGYLMCENFFNCVVFLKVGVCDFFYWFFIQEEFQCCVV